jgi:hypothetical protein
MAACISIHGGSIVKASSPMARLARGSLTSRKMEKRFSFSYTLEYCPRDTAQAPASQPRREFPLCGSMGEDQGSAAATDLLAMDALPRLEQTALALSATERHAHRGRCSKERRKGERTEHLEAGGCAGAETGRASGQRALSEERGEGRRHCAAYIEKFSEPLSDVGGRIIAKLTPAC